MKDTIILYPALGRGHLVSMVELGKLILTHHPSLSISILILTPPNQPTTTPCPTAAFRCESTAKYISSVSSSIPSITFHPITSISLTANLPPHILTLELSRRSNHHVLHALHALSKASNVKAIIIDFFNYSVTHVTSTFHFPTYFYYTSGAATLAVFLQLPLIHHNTTNSIKDIHAPLCVPGLPVIPLTELPIEVHDRASQSYKVYLEIAVSMRDSDGVIINTSDAIEGRVVKALTSGLCLPEGPTPPVYCIGPVISILSDEDEKGCLRWLHSQPSQSVVLLSFGSFGRFSKAQLKEIAVGLEKSQQRFLWIVRSMLDEVDSVEPSLDELLPQGFLERTKERGLVVKNWAPQAAILSHESLGGFVTHCGWNSVLEAVCEGVLMVTWPLYGEQKLNRVILVEEMKVALALNESKDGFVSATELEERVRELMESEKGKEIRQRIFKMRISAEEARAENGSSFLTLKNLGQLGK